MPYHPDSPLTLAIVTYDHAHLKTEQLIHRFLLKNRLQVEPKLDLTILALPFSPRPSRTVLIPHRPDQGKSVSSRDLADRYQLKFLPCTYDFIPEVADIYLIAGAGILSAQAIGKKKIINVHPGIIPSARGLDAFKWSILGDIPLGVTLHYIDSDVDAGETIAIVQTPIFLSDTIDVLARRHYELELDVLSDFLSFQRGKESDSSAAFPEGPSHMRMPIEIERDVIARFDKYKEKFSKCGLSQL